MNDKHYFSSKGQGAEQLLNTLASQTFLEDWCYPNPKFPDGNESCDLLIIYDNIAIIWQIKDLKLDKEGKYKKSEVEKNLRQLSGARRHLLDLKKPIKLHNNRQGEKIFDPLSIDDVFLISALLGEGEEAFNFVETFKSQTIHVFNRQFTEIALNELDTISDFTEYLSKKEQALKAAKQVIILGGEQQLLAYYLFNNRIFKNFNEYNFITINDDFYDNLLKKPEYIKKVKEDKVSYLVDHLINITHDTEPYNPTESLEYELIAREMARLNRFNRRNFSKLFFEARKISSTIDGTYYRRTMPTKEGVTFCFLFMDDASDRRKHRKSMLGLFCYETRGRIPQNNTVIGIATEKALDSPVFYDFCRIDKPDWTEQDQKLIEQYKKDLGINVTTVLNTYKEDEYPNA